MHLLKNLIAAGLMALNLGCAYAIRHKPEPVIIEGVGPDGYIKLIEGKLLTYEPAHCGNLKHKSMDNNAYFRVECESRFPIGMVVADIEKAFSGYQRTQSMLRNMTKEI
ncbi:MAG: hypothetical protein QXE64_01635 [Candidatus Pacearchaeota archaeon]